MTTATAFSAEQYPALPYPGARPAFSYVLDGDQILTLDDTGDANNWQVQHPTGMPLHRWLNDRGQAPMDARVPVLSYGSNACPSKLTTLRTSFGLPEPVIMTRCTVRGLAAVWAAGARGDGVVPATLAEMPGAEEHFLFWVAPDQWTALDRCEGRGGHFYDLVQLSQRQEHVVHTAEDQPIDGVHAYVGAIPERHPALDESGQPQRVNGAPHQRQPVLGIDPDQAPPASLGRHLAVQEWPSPTQAER